MWPERKDIIDTYTPKSQVIENTALGELFIGFLHSKHLCVRVVTQNVKFRHGLKTHNGFNVLGIWSIL